MIKKIINQQHYKVLKQKQQRIIYGGHIDPEYCTTQNRAQSEHSSKLSVRDWGLSFYSNNPTTNDKL